MLKKDWEFNTLGVYNYKKDGPLSYYFNYVAKNHERLVGDILEAGVFQGRSLLGMALMLKELGSSKKVYGFDTFSGFPPAYHKCDDLSNFEVLCSQGRISLEHYEDVLRNKKLREIMLGEEVTEKNISLSGDFGGNSMTVLQRKIQLLELDNIELVPGPFSETMSNTKYSDGWCAVLFDCDLYASYHTGLNFVWDDLCSGGYIYLDEYYSLKFAGARIAVDEFFEDKIEKPFLNTVKEGDFERWALIKGLE